MKPILVEISAGELIDRITIMQIRVGQTTDSATREHLHVELERLMGIWDAVVPPSAELEALSTNLSAVNRRLWQVEDELRLCEQCGEFDAHFITLARSVYHLNDRRAALKREVNVLLGIPSSEEKIYGSSGSSHDSMRLTMANQDRRAPVYGGSCPTRSEGNNPVLVPVYPKHATP